MKRVDAKEFAEHAAEYLESGESLEIEQDGRVLGRYLPAPAVAPSLNGHAANGHASKIDPEKHADMEWISRRLEEIYAETGLTEDEFADLLDPKKPFPYDNVPKS